MFILDVSFIVFVCMQPPDVVSHGDRAREGERQREGKPEHVQEYQHRPVDDVGLVMEANHVQHDGALHPHHA